MHNEHEPLLPHAPSRSRCRLLPLTFAALLVTSVAIMHQFNLPADRASDAVHFSANTRIHLELDPTADSTRLEQVQPVALNVTMKASEPTPTIFDAVCFQPRLATVPEESRTYSSVYNNEAIGTGHAQSNIDSPQAWSAASNVAGEFMVMDLKTIQPIAGVYIQKRAEGPYANQFVTQFTVEHSNDGITYTKLPRVFKGPQAISQTAFASVISARFVKIVVKEWNAHISMRAGVLVCDSGEKADRASAAQSTLGSQVVHRPNVGGGRTYNFLDLDMKFRGSGRVTKWKFESARAGTNMRLQVWRPSVGTANHFTLLCENYVTSTIGHNELVISDEDACRFARGDVVGWWVAEELIKWGKTGDDHQIRWQYTHHPPTVAKQIGFGGADTRSYSIEATAIYDDLIDQIDGEEGDASCPGMTLPSHLEVSRSYSSVAGCGTQCIYNAKGTPIMPLGVPISIAGYTHKFCADLENNLQCNQPTSSTEMEHFRVVDAGTGKVNLVAGSGKYCGLRDDKWLKCNHERSEGSVDEFTIATEDFESHDSVSLGHQTIALVNTKYGALPPAITYTIIGLFIFMLISNVCRTGHECIT